jgi:hypothetical protein
VRPVERTAKFSKATSEVAYGREINNTLSGNSSGGHSCSQHFSFPAVNQLYAPSKRKMSVGLCCVAEGASVIVIMLFYQLLDMPHLSGGWIILENEKFSLKGI